MDDHTLLEQLRADVDATHDDAWTDTAVEHLVQRSVRQGRRHRTRARVVGAVGGTAVAALAAVAILSSAPLAQTAVAPAAPHPSASLRPSVSRSTERPATTGVVSGTPADVAKTLTGVLPDAERVTDTGSERAEGSDGFAWENTAALTVRDSVGVAYLNVSIGTGAYDDGCQNLPDCRTVPLADGGTLWITHSPAGDKAGVDRSFLYDRPDGGHVSLMQRNYAEGDGPVTRTGLPLSDAEGRALVTDPAWDALFTG